ncbi:unnamed protein product [Ilex paraguariensis]|uniref:Calcineurin-like phosphoesterase domain-containing protein n=1 Tax=Ilex paraguariensis TaxID=185542 RepID=A0ABC8U324_9AQUA
MFVPLRRVLPVIIVTILLIYDDRVSIPSCDVVPAVDHEGGLVDEQNHPEDLKVMLVANLLLLGSEAGWANICFRDYHLSKFFRKSFEILRPDMLLVLGDVSARGADLSRSKWSSVVQQFHELMGPFLSLPFHVTLGDRDIGDCSGLNAESVSWIASNFPGLDSAGTGAFEISNISFVSLNAVALACSNNALRFSVEKIVERESIELQMDVEHTKEMINESSKVGLPSVDVGWRENAITSGSGPVVLLHFPLHQIASNNCLGGNAYEGTSTCLHENAKTSKHRRLVETGPYELSHTLPPNATEYIFQALRPRIVFSAHTHRFYDHTHSDGTREITVPAMSWDARNDPGFVVASFKRNGRAVTVSHCTLARESQVVITYVSFLVLFTSTMILVNKPLLTCKGR